jgi:hypothetical protein
MDKNTIINKYKQEGEVRMAAADAEIAQLEARIAELEVEKVLVQASLDAIDKLKE